MEKEIFYMGETPLQRFILFAFNERNISGGLEDAMSSSDDLDEVLEDYKNGKSSHKRIFDSHKGLEIDVAKYGLEY